MVDASGPSALILMRSAPKISTSTRKKRGANDAGTCVPSFSSGWLGTIGQSSHKAGLFYDVQQEKHEDTKTRRKTPFRSLERIVRGRRSASPSATSRAGSTRRSPSG